MLSQLSGVCGGLDGMEDRELQPLRIRAVRMNQTRGVRRVGADFSMKTPAGLDKAGHVSIVTYLNYMLLMENDSLCRVKAIWGRHPIEHGKK
jgi:hypothetical protein